MGTGMFTMLTRGGAQVPRLYLGAPEAEAEAVHTARIPLSEVYEDYHRLGEQLDHEKFIIIGRKGSGKSAFAEYICLQASESANDFARFIRKHDYDIELVVNGAKDCNIEFDRGAFFRWLIYTHIIKMFLESEAAQAASEFVLLQRFLEKNSGFIQIDRDAIVEQIRRHQFKVVVEPLRRFFKNELHRDLEVKEERAHFSRLLPHLEQVIRKVLNSKLEVANQNSYALFFDDLDLGYVAGNQAAKDAIVDLLRAAKMVNSTVFRDTRAKVVVLLRDDIEADLIDYADTAKLFSSYACRISWFQERSLQEMNENEIYLKKLISRRIAKACERAKIPCMTGDPWGWLVSYQPERKTTFRAIVEMTLMRPRDLLLFFKPLADGDFSIPLNEKAINKLRSEYAVQLVAEIKNEMSARYTVAQIEDIFALLKALPKKKDYGDALQLAKDLVRGVDPVALLAYLYDRSVVGGVDEKGLYWFKCRTRPGSLKGSAIDETMKITVQHSVREFLRG